MGAISRSGMMYWLLSASYFFWLIEVSARRLHDVGKSSWWQLIMITIIRLIPLIIWWPTEGSKKIISAKNLLN